MSDSAPPDERALSRIRERCRDPQWRERARALADELRATAEALCTVAPSAEALDDLEARARELRRAVEGPRRPRWYEAPESTRESFGDVSPVRGLFNPVAPPVTIETLDEGGRREIELRTTLGMAYEGPPLGVHGGWVAALWDDVLGEAQQLSEDGGGMTAWIKVRYRRPTPIGKALCFRAWIEAERGRRIECRGVCRAGDEVVSDAEATFMRVDFAEVESRLRGAGG